MGQAASEHVQMQQAMKESSWLATQAAAARDRLEAMPTFLLGPAARLLLEVPLDRGIFVELPPAKLAALGGSGTGRKSSRKPVMYQPPLMEAVQQLQHPTD